MTPANLGAVRPSFLTAAVLAFLSVPLSAQVVEKGRTFADLTASHPCASGYTDRIARVTDCDAAGTIGDGGGAFQCWAYCDGSAPWADIAIGGGAGGGSAYALLAGDADGQTIQGVTGSDTPRISLDATSAALWGGTYVQSAITTTASYSLLAFGDQELDGVHSVKADISGVWIGTPNNVTKIRVHNGGLNFLTAQTPPTNPTDACTAGDTILTATHLYFCPAADTWVRATLSTWEAP